MSYLPQVGIRQEEHAWRRCGAALTAYCEVKSVPVSMPTEQQVKITPCEGLLPSILRDGVYWETVCQLKRKTANKRKNKKRVGNSHYRIDQQLKKLWTIRSEQKRDNHFSINDPVAEIVGKGGNPTYQSSIKRLVHTTRDKSPPRQPKSLLRAPSGVNGRVCPLIRNRKLMSMEFSSLRYSKQNALFPTDESALVDESEQHPHVKVRVA